MNRHHQSSWVKMAFALLSSVMLLAGTVTAADLLQVPRKTWLRGEQIKAVIATELAGRNGLSVRLRGVNVPGEWNLALTNGAVAIDTSLYRVGDYELSLKSGNDILTAVPLHLRPAESPEVWYGNFTGRPAMTPGDDPSRDFRNLGFNVVYDGVAPDEALARGMYQVVHGNALRGSTAGLPEAEAKALHQVFMNSKGATKSIAMPCLRNPQVIDLAIQAGLKQMQSRAEHPGLLGIGIDDEIGMRAYDWNDTGGVTCYCASCRKLWKEKTGAEPPLPILLPPGTVVPDADPYLRYATEWTGWGDWYGPAEMAYNQAVAARLHQARPGLKIFQTPGAPYGELDVIHWEIYSYFFSYPATDAFSMMCQVRALRREQGHETTPIWPLIGWFQFQAPAWTGSHIAAQSRMCLAEGAASIWLTIMYWYDDKGRFKTNLFHEADHVEPAVREIGRLLEQFGPALIRVQPVRYPVAMLISRTTEIYQRVMDPAAIVAAKARGGYLEDAWEHSEATGLAFPALLQAGLPAEYVTEEELGRGALKNYAALVLIDQKYARQSVVDRIQEFIAAGGVVFADKASLVQPAQAKKLPFDSALPAQMSELGLRAKMTISTEQLDIVMDRFTGLQREWALLTRPLVAKELPAKARIVTSDNPAVIVRLGRSGDTDVVYVLNTDVRNSQSAMISAQTRGRYAYDFFAGATAPLAAVGGTLQAPVTVLPGGWQVYAVTPEPVAALKLSAVSAGGEVTVDALVQDPQSKTVNGAFPVQLTVTGPKGEILPYGGFFATDGGKLTRRFKPAVNDPAGAWMVTAVNLTTGHTATAEFKR